MSEGTEPLESAVEADDEQVKKELSEWLVANGSEIIDSSFDKETAIEKLSVLMSKCRGTGQEIQDQDETVHDCTEHTLDDFNKKDGQNIELDPRLANFIFNEIISRGYKVIITSGFRCPDHNHFSQVSDESGKTKKDSLHSHAEAVDFIVLGENGIPLTYAENKQLERELEGQEKFVIPNESMFNKDDPDFNEKNVLQRIHDTNDHVSLGINTLFFITSYTPDVGRDPDNNHKFSYIHLDFRTIKVDTTVDGEKDPELKKFMDRYAELGLI
jgi:uncharacterized protein YcbK (DUF882 family)